MEDIQVSVDYKHKYQCIKALLKKKREDCKKLISFRDTLISDNIRLKKKIQNLENELGRSTDSAEHGVYAVLENSNASDKLDTSSKSVGNEPLEKITNIERVYCDVCPHELGDIDKVLGKCERCGSKIDS
jgi:RNA polymerase-binding transcription factor DksA